MFAAENLTNALPLDEFPLIKNLRNTFSVSSMLSNPLKKSTEQAVL